MVNNGINISCYGCGVCATACPRNALSLKKSTEGFWVPIVDENLCIECGICEKVCSFLYEEVLSPSDSLQKFEYRSVWNKDAKIRNVSTSGGAGYAIASSLSLLGYRLVGVKYDPERNIACHFVADDIRDFYASVNSKYLPSYTIDGFSDLMNGDKHAVFGTPCQIDSLRRWARLKKKESNFVFIDLFCHGVPSYLHWNAYLKYHLADDEHLIKPIFRDKKNGWHRFTISLETDKKIKSRKLQSNDLFQNLFFGNYTLNLPCYTCKFRKYMSAADIRMGDLWGSKYLKNEDGVTGILILTPTGKKILDSITPNCGVVEETQKTVFEGQLSRNISIPIQRRKILEGLKNNKSLFLLYLRYASKMWLKNLIPYEVKNGIKNFIYKIKDK